MKRRRSRLRSPKRHGYTRRARFEPLEVRRVLSAPSIAAIADVDMLSGSPLHIPLDAFDADGDALTFSAVSDNQEVNTFIPEGNRSMRISVLSDDGAIDGDMVFELFEGRVPRVTGRIIQLAEEGFYDGLTFHRVAFNGDGTPFVIQGGDPTGTGAGGSGYPDFDDQFHVDLQHNRDGILSMAKSTDDTNDCQFFVTADPCRHLDSQHSVFGQLTEGDDIRHAIQYTARTGSQPDVDVVMTSVEIFVDHENGVLMLKADEGYTGQAEITVTVDDGNGGQDQVTFNVNVTPDTVNNAPYLNDVDEIRTTVDTATEFQLTATDVEEDGVFYLDQWTIHSNQLNYPYVIYDNPGQHDPPDEIRLPLVCHSDLDYVVTLQDDPEDPEALPGGHVVVTPSNGLVGIHPITVASLEQEEFVDFTAMDYQFIPIFIAPAEAPTAELDMTLVRDLVALDESGEVDALPEDQWIDEWDSFTIEVWATVTEDGAFGVHTVSTDLMFDNNLFVATEIEHGPAFIENLSGEIDNATGRVTTLGGTTDVFSVESHSGLLYVDEDGNSLGSDYAWAPEDVGLYGDGRPVLVARVHFEPNPNGTGVPLNADNGYMLPETEFGFGFDNAEVLWSSQDATALTVNGLENGELWPVMYDLNDDGKVGLGDLSLFAAAYRHTVGEAGSEFTWASDFNRDGEVGLGDLSYFASAYRENISTPGRLNYPGSFPDAWRPAGEGAALMGTLMAGSEGEGSSEGESDGGDIGEQELAAAHAMSTVRRSTTTTRRKIEPVDVVMGMYGPEM